MPAHRKPRTITRQRWDSDAAWKLYDHHGLTSTERLAFEFVARRIEARRAGAGVYMEQHAHHLRRTVAHAQRVMSGLVRRGLLTREHGRRRWVGDRWITEGPTRYRLTAAGLNVWRATTSKPGANPPRFKFVPPGRASSGDDHVDLASAPSHALASVSGAASPPAAAQLDAANDTFGDSPSRCEHGRHARACLRCVRGRVSR